MMIISLSPSSGNRRMAQFKKERSHKSSSYHVAGERHCSKGEEHRFLTTYELPSIAHSKTQNVQYELHEEFGMLHQLLAGTLSLFDLSGTIPRKALELGGPANPIQSFTRVSSNSIVTFSNGSTTLFETSFGSVRGSVSLKSID